MNSTTETFTRAKPEYVNYLYEINQKLLETQCVLLNSIFKVFN